MFEELHEDVLELFQSAERRSNLDSLMKIKYLNQTNLKKIGIVAKATDRERFLNKIDCFVIINEEVFDQLDDMGQKIIVDDLISRISYNDNKGKVEILKEDFNGFKGVIEKYTYQKLVDVQEMIKLIFEQKNDKESDIV